MRIPNELCGDIVRHVDGKADLYNLLFISPAFQHEAHLAMLTSIDLARCKGAQDRNASLRKQMFKFLSQPNNLYLARAVRQLVFLPHVIEDEMLEIVIPQMVNLRHLKCEPEASDPIEQAKVPAIHPSFLRCPCKLSSLAIRGTGMDLVGCIPFLKINPDIEDFRSFMSPPIEFSNGGVLSNITRLSFVRPSRHPSLHMFIVNRSVIRMSIGELHKLNHEDSNDFQHLRVLDCDSLGQIMGIGAAPAPQPVFRNVEVLFVHQVSQYLLHFDQ